MSCSMSNEQKLCKVKIFQLQALKEFWYFMPGHDILPEQFENDNPGCKKDVAGCKILQVIY